MVCSLVSLSTEADKMNYACVEELTVSAQRRILLFIASRSAMPACAAMYPGAPITPPPGWAPLLHSSSLFIGVKGAGGPMSPDTGRLRKSWSIDKAP